MINKRVAIVLVAGMSFTGCRSTTFRGDTKTKNVPGELPGIAIDDGPSPVNPDAKGTTALLGAQDPGKGSTTGAGVPAVVTKPDPVASGTPTPAIPKNDGPAPQVNVTPQPVSALMGCTAERPAFCQLPILAKPLKKVSEIVVDSTGVEYTSQAMDGLSWKDLAIMGSCVSSSTFTTTEWSNIKFENNELIIANFSDSRWFNSRISNVDARHSNFSRSYMKNTRFESSCFAKANIAGAEMENVSFNASNAEGANFSGMTTTGRFEIKDAKLKGINFSGSLFHGPVSFQNSDLRQANLQNVTFEDSVNWSGAQLAGATWTDGRTCADNSVGSCL